MLNRFPIDTINLDIDDVLNQCTKYALQWLGIPFDYSNFIAKYPVKHGYNIVNVANEILGYERFDVPSFWNMIPRVFWASVPVSDEFQFIIDESIKLVGVDNVCLLTGPTKDPDCLAGKLEWINRVMPKWAHRQYLIGPRKRFCADPHTLLIDDSDDNKKAFESAPRFGRCLLVPRPWNSLNGVNTHDYLVRQFQNLHDERDGHIAAASSRYL